MSMIDNSFAPDDETLALIGGLFQTGMERPDQGRSGQYQNPFTPNWDTQRNMQNFGDMAGIENIAQLLGIGAQPELPAPPMEPINDVKTAWESNPALARIIADIEAGTDPARAVNRVRDELGESAGEFLGFKEVTNNGVATMVPDWDLATSVATSFAETNAKLKRDYTQSVAEWERESAAVPDYGFNTVSRDGQIDEMMSILADRRQNAIANNPANAQPAASGGGANIRPGGLWDRVAQNADASYSSGNPMTQVAGRVAQGGAVVAPTRGSAPKSSGVEVNWDQAGDIAKQTLAKYGKPNTTSTSPKPDTAAGLQALALVNQLFGGR